jgi:hypothetical protein
MATRKKKGNSDGGILTAPVADYRHPEATRKNNPPAKIAAEGHVPLLPKAEYSYSASTGRRKRPLRKATRGCGSISRTSARM